MRLQTTVRRLDAFIGTKPPRFLVPEISDATANIGRSWCYIVDNRRSDIRNVLDMTGDIH